ncbi:zinc ribbon domain-containing protein [Phycisphaera mikurensis]|uniref:Putative regulatory protein n=1 Tax=Phycisphaera mikurensis (strain NBRC 102666 / KCTC 22515 / FYK2301M01) TaxID=1142394 RepID=I0II46_PHYMF|nr:zinc ribbon domain-containing protein [Phycisphaera mikurensis]MBB6442503.1 putative FmdB family regulatory protein [Phycisphaera mikurensis]BAM04934.1 putative regulatory protein [Phycisphaera mikurensis NBRC 102666]
MPRYDFDCPAHGTFEVQRPIARSGAKCACPRCGADATRLFASPMTRKMAPSQITAHDRNEKSAHAPHVCGSGCSHKHGAGRVPLSETTGRGVPTASRGPRPWVIEHG